MIFQFKIQINNIIKPNCLAKSGGALALKIHLLFI